VGISRSFSTLVPDSYTIVKSMQRGSVAITDTNPSGTATISSVTTGKATLRYLGFFTDDDSGQGNLSLFPHVGLTNPTTVTATRHGTQNAGSVSFEVDEKP
jgi:hypothetical protein